jgi:hypothetical protein
MELSPLIEAHLVGMSGDPASRAEAIHQVDSVFGVLVVVMVFWTNTMLNIIRDYLTQSVIGGTLTMPMITVR